MCYRRSFSLSGCRIGVCNFSFTIRLNNMFRFSARKICRWTFLLYVCLYITFIVFKTRCNRFSLSGVCVRVRYFFSNIRRTGYLRRLRFLFRRYYIFLRPNKFSLLNSCFSLSGACIRIRNFFLIIMCTSDCCVLRFRFRCCCILLRLDILSYRNNRFSLSGACVRVRYFFSNIRRTGYRCVFRFLFR